MEFIDWLEKFLEPQNFAQVFGAALTASVAIVVIFISNSVKTREEKRTTAKLFLYSIERLGNYLEIEKNFLLKQQQSNDDPENEAMVVMLFYKGLSKGHVPKLNSQFALFQKEITCFNSITIKIIHTLNEFLESLLEKGQEFNNLDTKIKEGKLNIKDYSKLILEKRTFEETLDEIKFLEELILILHNQLKTALIKKNIIAPFKTKYMVLKEQSNKKFRRLIRKKKKSKT